MNSNKYKYLSIHHKNINLLDNLFDSIPLEIFFQIIFTLDNIEDIKNISLVNLKWNFIASLVILKKFKLDLVNWNFIGTGEDDEKLIIIFILYLNI